MYFSVLYCYETGPIVLIKIGPVPYNQGPVPWSSVQMLFPELVFQLHLKTDEEALCPRETEVVAVEGREEKEEEKLINDL